MADTDARLAALEQRMDGAEQRLDMEAGLGASRDRDIADIRLQLRAHGRSLQAMAHTLSDHGRAIDGLRAEMRAGFAETRAETRAGLAAITGLLDRLIERGRPQEP